METAQPAIDEEKRIDALRALNILDTGPEERFDHITRFVRDYFEVPIALISLVDTDRQWFKSKQGLDVCETERSISFCGHAIHHDDIFVVEDTHEDSRFADNPLVTGEPGIRFYAGYPLHTTAGYRIGTLCIIDTHPRAFSHQQRERLRDAGFIAEELIRQRESESFLAASGLTPRISRWAGGFGRGINSRGFALGCAVLTFGLILFLAILFAREKSEAFIAQHNLARQKQLETVAASLESSLSSLVSQSFAVRALVDAKPDLTRREFEHFAQSLARGKEAIVGYQLVQNRQATHQWLAQPDSASLPDGLLNSPEPSIQGQRSSLDSPNLDESWRLDSGDQLLVSRLPVAILDSQSSGPDKHGGFAQTLINLSGLIERHQTAELPLTLIGSPARLDAPGGLPAPTMSSAVTGAKLQYDLQLPGYHWTLRVDTNAPSPGRWPGYRQHYVIFTLLALLAGFFVYCLLCLPSKLRAIAEQAARSRNRSQRLLRNAIEAFPYGFVVYDSQNKIFLFNENFVHLYPGIRALIKVGADRNQLRAKAIELGQMEQTASLEETRHIPGESSDIHLTDGRWVRVVDTPLQDGSVACFHTDITDLKEKETALSQAKDLAEEANQMKTRFLANISHEVRTPLNGVLGLMEVLLEDDSLADQQRHYLQTAQDSARYLLKILNDILDVSRIEAGTLLLEKSPFNLVAAINAAIAILRPDIERKGLALSQTIDTTIPAWVVGDEGRIRQILLNVISNAIKFTDTGSVIVNGHCKSLGKDNALIALSVSDTGCGIGQDKLGLVRKPFIQLNASANKRQSGTGLGLAICESLVEAMGGAMTIESREQCGTTVTVKLPLVIAAPPIETATGNRAGDDSVYPATDQQYDVLLADDGDTNRLVIEAMLEGSRYVIHPVADGLTAVETARQKPFDLILMDIYMPGLDGIEATRRTRHPNCLNNTTPIIALTANAMAGDREKFIASGMNDYLSKPVKKADLLNLLDRWIDAKHETRRRSST